MRSPSRWLTWNPASQEQKTDTRFATKPTEPTKPIGSEPSSPRSDGSVGFAGFVRQREGENHAPERSSWFDWQPSRRAPQVATKPTKPTKPAGTTDAVAQRNAFPGSESFVGNAEVENHGKPISGDPESVLKSCRVVLQSPDRDPATPIDEAVASNMPELQSWLTVFGGVENRPSPAPTPVSAARIMLAGGPVTLTIAKHNCVGENVFGQASAEFPYCAIDARAWREKAFDLKATSWFRSPAEVTAPSEATRTEPEDRRTCASFPGGVCVELRHEGRSRWLMYVNGRRRKDLATPYLDHARRCAEHFYGSPVGGWNEPITRKENV